MERQAEAEAKTERKKQEAKAEVEPVIPSFAFDINRALRMLYTDSYKQDEQEQDEEEED